MLTFSIFFKYTFLFEKLLLECCFGFGSLKNGCPGYDAEHKICTKITIKIVAAINEIGRHPSD